jgi:hypothetical protein
MQVSAADTIIPENIKKDETILGVTGNYDPAPPIISGKITIVNNSENQDFKLKDLDSDLTFDEIGPKSEKTFDTISLPMNLGMYLKNEVNNHKYTFNGNYQGTHIEGTLEVISYDHQGYVESPDETVKWNFEAEDTATLTIDPKSTQKTIVLSDANIMSMGTTFVIYNSDNQEVGSYRVQKESTSEMGSVTISENELPSQFKVSMINGVALNSARCYGNCSGVELVGVSCAISADMYIGGKEVINTPVYPGLPTPSAFWDIDSMSDGFEIRVTL